MSQSPKRWSIKGAVFAASLSVVFAACGRHDVIAERQRRRIDSSVGSSPVGQRRRRSTASVYPATGEAPCGVAPYTGQLKKITAVDRLTVEFQLCGPDADFLPKIAFSAFGIQDSAYLEAHVPDGTLLDKPNGTGPYKLKEWSQRQPDGLGRQSTATGATRP